MIELKVKKLHSTNWSLTGIEKHDISHMMNYDFDNENEYYAFTTDESFW